MGLPTLDDIREAAKIIKTRTRRTPLIRSRLLSEVSGGDVHLKLENLQKTGAFKIRGAYTALSKLKRQGASKGVVTASSGNHGQAVALAADELNINATIVVPEHVSEAKLEKIQEFDVSVIRRGTYEDVESIAKQMADEKGLLYVSPYNHPDIIAGQGTIGLEIMQSLPNVDSIIAPVGGGGLISGVAIATKGGKPEIEIVGVQSEASPMVYKCWKANDYVEVQETESIASGLMGGVQKESMTLRIMSEMVDNMFLVSESAIMNGIRLLWEGEGQRVEGAAAVGVAAILERPEEFRDKTTAIIITGGNIQESEFQQLIADGAC